MDRIVLDGMLVEGASISLGVTGNGFAYGYGVFETIKFREGTACCFREHVARLARAVQESEMKTVIDHEILKEQAMRLFQANGVMEGVFKIVVFEDIEATRIVMFIRTVGIQDATTPLRLTLSSSIVASQAFTSRHKTLNYMEVVRDLRRIRSQGFDECVYRNENGFLTECSVSNLFFVSEGILKTAHLDCGLLDGIARARLIEIADTLDLRVQEGRFSIEELLEADEVFVTNSAVGARSVSLFEAGEGRSSTYGTTVTEQLRAAFEKQEHADLAHW